LKYQLILILHAFSRTEVGVLPSIFYEASINLKSNNTRKNEIKKFVHELNRHLPNEDHQMVNKIYEKYSTLLPIRKIQHKHVMRFLLISE
jgi:hypothetical protein